MYIDNELVQTFKKSYGDEYNIMEAIDENGVWYTLDEIKEEWENPDLTLEEIISACYLVVEDNEMFFCTPEDFLYDCDEWVQSFQ